MEVRMRVRNFLILAMIVVLTGPAFITLQAQGGVALSGVVSSQQEGNMEGVLVTARREGANHTVTVVSDAQGRYSYPYTHLDAGTYALKIRATGYDLVDPRPITVTSEQTATADLRLQETKDLSKQLTSLEWVMAMPGTPEQKDRFVYEPKSCNYCHSFQRIARSKHTAAQYVRVIKRMNSYYPDGTAASDDGRGSAQPLLDYGDSFGRATPDGPNEGLGDNWGSWPMTELGEFLATVTLSGGRTTWPYELKAILPRPTGPATRVIITEWDQPRKVAESHDMDVDSKGNVWYGDESHQVIGKLNPKTHTFTEYDLPPVPAGHLPGTRDVTVDNDDNVWFPMRVAGGAALLTKFDPDTQEITTVKDATGQFTALGPDNKVWLGGALNPFHRVDAATATLEATFLECCGYTGYQVVVNSKGNPYMATFGGINGYDVEADEAKYWPLSTPFAFGRRGRMDAQDRYWFAEYNTDKITMFDTRTEEIKEWSLRKYFTPYTASAPDKSGYVWATSNMTDRLARLDPETGEIVEFLMPNEMDVKEITFDPTAEGVSLLMSNMRSARILRVEILD